MNQEESGPGASVSTKKVAPVSKRKSRGKILVFPYKICLFRYQISITLSNQIYNCLLGMLFQFYKMKSSGEGGGGDDYMTLWMFWIHRYTRQYVCSVTQSCPNLSDPMDCSLPGSSDHGIFQARKLGWVTISFSRNFSWPRNWTCISINQINHNWKKKKEKTRCTELRSIYCGVLKGTDKYKIYVPALGPENSGKIYVPRLPDLYHVHRCTMSSRSVLDTSAILEMLDLFSTLLTMCSWL